MSDYSDYHSPEKVNARRRARYIREHAHHALQTAALCDPEPMISVTPQHTAQRAVALTAALYDALPPDPDADQGSGAPAHQCSDPQCCGTTPAAESDDEGPALPEIPRLPGPAPLLPVEPEITTRSTAPACTCTGQQPCSAACRRCIPERRQSAGPQEATHAERAPRRPVSERLARLADCKTSTDAATIAAYHAHLASSNIQMCGACGAKLDGLALDPGRPFDASTAELEALVRYVASAPIQEDAGTEGAGVSP